MNDRRSRTKAIANMDTRSELGQDEVRSVADSVADAIDELLPDLPVNIQADFSPLNSDKSLPPGRRPSAEPAVDESSLAQQSFDNAVKAAEDDNEPLAVECYLKAARHAEAAREWYIAAVACHRVGDFLRNPKPPCDLERAFRMYRRAVSAYQSCGLSAEARELSYRIMTLRMKRAAELKLPWWYRWELIAFWAIAGFGYRPFHVIRFAMVSVLFYAVVYWCINGIVSPNSGEHISLQHAIYFSGTTFSTVGYGDLVPAPHAQMIALTEAALGSFTMGLFVAVLSHRLNP